MDQWQTLSTLLPYLRSHGNSTIHTALCIKQRDPRLREWVEVDGSGVGMYSASNGDVVIPSFGRAVEHFLEGHQ